MKLQFPSVDACSPQSPYRGVHRNQGSSPPITGSGLHSLQQPSAPTFFFFFFYNYVHSYMHSFCHFPGIHWVCASCTVPFSPSTTPTIQTHTVQYMLVFPQHTKFSQQYHFPCWTIHLLFQVLHTIPMYRATNKSPNVLQWH